MYKLYIIPGSCSTGIHALLNELEQDVDIIHRDDVENYSVISPTNQVPALQSEDSILLEGSAIVLDLIRKHGDTKLSEDQNFIRWLMFNYATLHPAYSKLFAVNAAMNDSTEKKALLEILAQRVTELWDIVDKQLDGKKFMLGDKPSVIDYLLAVYVRWGNTFPETDIKLGHNVVALVNRVLDLPQFKQALEREEVQYIIPENAIAA